MSDSNKRSLRSKLANSGSCPGFTDGQSSEVVHLDVRSGRTPGGVARDCGQVGKGWHYPGGPAGPARAEVLLAGCRAGAAGFTSPQKGGEP